jgi:CRP-like cAMP-binding protein
MDITCIDPGLGLLDDDAEVSSFDRGDVIFSVGGEINHVFCICRGNVGVFKRGYFGESLPLYVGTVGDLLGIPEVFGSRHFTTTAIALEPVSAIAVTREALMEFVRTSHEGAITLIRQICRRLDMAERGL